MLKYSGYLFLLLCNTVTAQCFLNGDFELHNLNQPSVELCICSVFDTIMPGNYCFGSGGSYEIIHLPSSFTFATPLTVAENGSSYMALKGGKENAIYLKLSNPLVSGNTYTISFYNRANDYSPAFPMEIGLSDTQNNLGAVIYTTPDTAVNGTWTKRTFTFTAPNNGEFITVLQQDPLYNTSSSAFQKDEIIVFKRSVEIDNFSFECPFKLDLGNDTALCGNTTLELNAGAPGASYLWQDNSINSKYTVSKKGIYWVSVTANNCCLKDVITVDYPLPLSKNFITRSDDNKCDNPEAILSIAPYLGKYLWSTGDTVNQINVDKGETYWLKVNAVCGNYLDSIDVPLTVCSVEPLLDSMFIPNVITPNDDGYNDAFQIIWMNTLNVSDVECQIYNRWGEKVAKLSGTGASWEPKTMSNDYLSSGVYYWVLNYSFDQKKKQKSGFVQLIK